jgi:hypothetical protein
MFIAHEAADAFAAGAAEGQRRVDLVLDLDQRVENHRAAGREVDVVRVDTRVLAVVRVPAIDLEGAHLLRAGRRGEVTALADLRVLREREFSHGFSIPGQ